jgi:hypothetical protein
MKMGKHQDLRDIYFSLYSEAKECCPKCEGKCGKGCKCSCHDEVKESAVPGKPAERLGAVTGIPKDERDAARERLLAKTKEIRNKKKIREEIEEIEEVAPPGAKAERMVKHIKKSYASDGELTDKEKSIAYATAWKHATKKSRYREGYENYKNELREHHREKFESWIVGLQEDGYDITKWEPEELVDTYIKENNLWKSETTILEALFGEGLKQARKNVGAGKCWDGYTAKGTKKKGGKEVPNCVPEEVEHLDEMPYQVYGSPDGKKEKKIGKPVKSGKYAAARAAELADTHRATGGTYRSQKEEVELDEARRGPAAPGKAEKGEKTKVSLAALAKRQKALDAHEKKTGKKLDISKSPEGKSHAANFPGSRQPKKVKGEKETPAETQRRQTNRQVDRVVKHGHTSKERKEVEAMAKHTSPRD